MSATERGDGQVDRLDLLAHSIAQAMADYENAHRYELENGSQSTGVEPYEYGASDFEEIAAFVAERLEGAVDEAKRLREAIETHRRDKPHRVATGLDRWLWASLDDVGGQSETPAADENLAPEEGS